MSTLTNIVTGIKNWVTGGFCDNSRIATAESTISSHTSSISNLSSRKYITDTYNSGTSWYRKWSDGWIEQGGDLNTTTSGWANVTKTFVISFSNTNYVVICVGNWDGECSCTVNGKTASSFTVRCAVNNTTQKGAWYACGF